MSYSFLDGWWTDAGTFESLLHAANLVAETRSQGSEARSQNAETADSSDKATIAPQ